MHQPIYFYVPVVLVGCFPWVIFLFQAFIHKFKSIKANWSKSSIDIYMVLWPILIFVFFTIPQSKIIGYMLPVFPPIALIIGAYLVDRWDQLGGAKSVRIATTVFLALGVMVTIAFISVAYVPNLSTAASFPFLCAMAVIAFAGSLITAGLAFHQSQFKLVFISLLLTTMIFAVVGTASIHTFQLNNTKPLSMMIKQKMKPGDEIVCLDHYYQDLPIYTQQRIYVVADWKNPEIIYHDNWKRELAEGVIYKHVQQPWLIGNQQFINMWNGKKRLFVMMKAKIYKRLRSMVKGKIYTLGQYMNVMVVSNRP